MKPAFVLSASTNGLGVIRALGAMGVPVIIVHYDKKDTGHVSKYVTHKVQAPHPEKFEDDFINLLIECSDRFESGVLIPVSDETVVAVARNKARLYEHFLIACPEWEIAQQYIEKKYTYALAEQHGIPVPETIVPDSLDDVVSYAKHIDFPCLVKPSQSHLFYERFKCKMFPVENTEQMISVYQQASDAGLEVMLQEIIPGDDINVVNYNAYFEEGKPFLEFTAEHIRNAPPRWGSPRVVLSKAIPEVIDPGRGILQAMNYSGYACVEFKKDARDGIYKLMEVNGRHNLSTLLAVRCGINFPWLEYKHMVEGEQPKARDFKIGIYWVDIGRDVGYSIFHLSHEHYSIKQYLRPYFKPHVFAVFDLKDPKPFIKKIIIHAKLVGRALFKRLQLFRK